MKIYKFRSVRLVLTSLLVNSLVACSLPLKSNVPVDEVYRLSPKVMKVDTPIKANIYIPQVTVNPALDNQKIVLSTTDNRLDFIASSRWPDNLSSYLQAIVVEGLSTSDAFQSVSERILDKQNNYRLLLRVTDFQAELPAGRESVKSNQQPVTVVVVIEATLLKVDDQRLIGQQRYTARKRNVNARTSQIIFALESALSEVLNRLVTDLRDTLSKNS